MFYQNEFRSELIKNISETNFSFIDIENFNIHSKNDIYKKIEEFIEGFINKSTFLEKYEYLKGIFDELIKKGKYIEEKNIVNRINNYIDLNLMPLNNDNLFVQCKKNYISNNSEITIFQEIIDKDRENYDYIPIISKNFPFIINKCPILLENVPKIDNETSFYCISDNSVIKLMIKKQLEIGEDPKFDCIINIFNTLATTALTVLTKDKNIVFKSNQNIILFDDNFSIENAKELNQKLPGEFSTVENVLTIDKNSFIFTIKNFNSKSGDYYFFYTGSGYLYAASSSNNYLRTEATADMNAAATISISNTGNATITFQGANSHKDLRFHEAEFTCYTTGSSTGSRVQLYKEVSPTVTTTRNYTSFCSPYSVDFTGTAITVCKAKVDGHVVRLTAIDGNIAPANKGVILVGEPTTVDMTFTATTPSVSDNDLIAVLTDTAIPWNPSDGMYNYILQNGVFKKATGAKLRAGRAYLSTSYDVTATSAPELQIVFGDVTGISDAMHLNNNERITHHAVYDLQGRQVNVQPHSQLKKGLYIVNGKKVVIK